jgi:lipoate-protein ligase A
VEATHLRVIRWTETDPAFNVALEEALHRVAETEPFPLVRFWYSERAVILGRSRSVGEDVFLENCRADEIPVLRRHSGGGTVYIHPDVLNFTVVAPYTHGALKPRSRIRESVVFLLKPVLEALKKSGIEADISKYGDIMVDGRKVGGNAQARKKQTILHHGTLMLDDRVVEMERYLRVPIERRGLPHSEFVAGLRQGGRKFDDGFIQRLSTAGWAKCFGTLEVSADVPSSEELRLAEELLAVKYSREEYNLRR